MRKTYIADARSRPMATFSEALDTDSGDRMWASVFPGIAIT